LTPQDPEQPLREDRRYRRRARRIAAWRSRMRSMAAIFCSQVIARAYRRQAALTEAT
jgi:hypothetical protein